MNSKEICDFFDIIHTFNGNEISKGTNISDLHNTLKVLYEAVRRCSTFCPENFDEQHRKKILSFIDLNLKIIIDTDHAAETSFLSGICLLAVLQKILTSESCCDFIICLHFIISEACQLSEAGERAVYISKQLDVFPSRHNCEEKTAEELNLLAASLKLWSRETSENIHLSSLFPLLYFLHGVIHGISYQKPNLFLHRLENFNNMPFVISMFDAIHQCCITPCSAQFHAFSVLMNWLKLCENLQSNFCDAESYFSTSSKIVKKIIYILEANWESPIQGVTGFIREIYKLLIKLCEEECRVTDNESFILFLLERTMKLSWSVKGKYLVLSALIPYLSYKKFLEDFPEATTAIISNLRVNYSSSITGEVYKAIVSDIKKSSTSEELSSIWSTWWLDTIVQSFFSEDKLLIQNIKNIILPWTIKTVTCSYKLLLNAVENSKENKNAFEIVLIRIAIECSVCSLDGKEIYIIKKNLHHGDVWVRMEVFTVLCSSPKRSEKVSTEVIQLLKEFIVFNLNVDSAMFHQRVLAQMKTLLTRMRDSSVQEYRLVLKKMKTNLDLSQLEFVDWLVHVAIKNVMPGSCFQRRRLCLEMLNVIYDVFVVTPLGTKKKEKPSDFVGFLIKYAQEQQQLLLCFKDNSLLNTLPCITDFTDEIRRLAANLLKNHCQIYNAEYFLEYAFSLCNNPDVRHSDSGALLCQIYFKNENSKRSESNLMQPFTPQCNDCPDVLNFLNLIFNTALSQLNHAKSNLLVASLSQPLHGSLLALHHCISDASDFFLSVHENYPHVALNFLKNAVQLCDDAVKYMLFAMSGKDQTKTSASFAEIGEALRDLALSKYDNLTDISEMKIGGVEISDGEFPSVSAECELILSCCWHSIKNSCCLLSELTAHVAVIDMNSEIKQQLLFQIASILSFTLMNCRHRGVVDACRAALSDFCRHIASDKNIYQNITMHLIQEAIQSFAAETFTSVTRRSAGLPLLFQAVVSSEQTNVNRKLLSFSIEKLLDLISLPLPSDINEKTDLPQAHAYHILKALVTDSSLSQNILLWSNLIIPACVQGFSSQCWAIRNGALQLFGVLLPRLCGQKKVRNDESEHNSVTTSELFSRFPNLKSYLLEHLQKSVDAHTMKKLSPELAPLLLLIAKLIPHAEENSYEMEDFRPLLEKMLGSPVWKIRTLASTALSQFFSWNQAIALLNMVKIAPIKCNELHGVLLTVQKVLKRSKESFQDVEDVHHILVNVLKFVREDIQCNIISALLADIIIELSDIIEKENFIELCSKDNRRQSQIGYSLISSKETLLNLSCCRMPEIPKILNQQPRNDQQIQKVCLKFLSLKLLELKLTSVQYSKENLQFWKQIFVSLIQYIHVSNHQSIVHRCLKFMINLCSDWKIGSYVLDLQVINLVDHHLKHHLEMKSGLFVAALSFTLWSLCQRALIRIPKQSCDLEKWNFIFNGYCRPQSSEILRMQAAESLSIFGPTLINNLKLQIEKQSASATVHLICLCEGSLILLQDEDEEIRRKACWFPSNIPHDYEITALQSNIGIRVVCQLLTTMLKSNVMYILYLWNKLQNMPSTAKILLAYSQKKKTNLFEQEYVNVYAEPIQLALLYEEQLVRAMIFLSESDFKEWNALVKLMMSDTLFEMEDVTSTLNYIGKENLAIDFTWQHQVYLALRKLQSQVKVAESQESLPQFKNQLKPMLQTITSEWNVILNFLPKTSLLPNCNVISK